MSRMITEFDEDEGVLTLRVPAREYRLRWHPAPHAEARNVRDRWIEAWPDFRLFFQGPGESKAVTAFRQTIPADLVSVVERFPSHQWNLLVLLGAEPYACDLARTCPVLAFCVANSHCLLGGTEETAAAVARRHCRQPRREIAGWLGFPPAVSTVNVMARIRPEAAAPAAMVGLQIAMRGRSGLTKLLLHLPSINAGVLFFASRWRLDGLPAFSLLSEIANAPEELETAVTGNLLIDALRLMSELDPARRAPVFESADQVRRFHEPLARQHHEVQLRREAERIAALRRQEERALAERRRQARDLERILRRPFPPPPFPGTDTIVPLASVKDLVQEGAEQSNCVAIMEVNVKLGGRYLYRVLSPSRATMDIARGADRRWRLIQIQGPSPTFALPGAVGCERNRKRRETRYALDGEPMDMLHETTCIYSNARSTGIATGSQPNRFGIPPAAARSHAKSCWGRRRPRPSRICAPRARWASAASVTWGL